MGIAVALSLPVNDSTAIQEQVMEKVKLDDPGLFLRKVARECQNARVISFARAIPQVKIHKHRLFLGKASYSES